MFYLNKTYLHKKGGLKPHSLHLNSSMELNGIYYAIMYTDIILSFNDY